MANRFSSLVSILIMLPAASCTLRAQNNINKGFAVVELFTSEGCSSCPPADALITDLKNDHKEGIYILAFHVDYWDRLGWKDTYSNNDFTKRQSKYADAFKLQSVYTPQLVINGKNELVGSDRQHLYYLTSEALKNSTTENITLSAKHINSDKITISYAVSGNANDEVLNIALVQSDASSDVKNGENKGRKLHHVNIVRVFKTISLDKNTGEVSLEIPRSLSYTDCSIIAYSQQEDMLITAAKEVIIE